MSLREIRKRNLNMSTALALNSKDENAPTIGKEKIISAGRSSADRRTLKTLQVGPDGKLIGSEKKKPSMKISLSKKPVKVFVDRKKTWLEMGTQTEKTSVLESEAQTDISGAMPMSTSSDCHNDSGVGAGDIDQEAYDLMVKEPIPENYWRDLAEERRCSLAEALSENEMLHQSMEEMKEENQNLSLLASQAEYLASVLNDVLGEKKQEETSDDSSDNKKDKTEEKPATGDKEIPSELESKQEEGETNLEENADK